MIGTRIDNYRIVAKLGDGGMGSVYHAVDEMLERDVALKFLRPELSSNKELAERFRTEAVILARLNHSNIASLYGLHRYRDEVFMAMEFVDGQTVEAILARHGRVPPNQAVSMAGAMLQALDYAHRRGIVHRDIKSANVMVSSGGAIKVMDFGIARALGGQRRTRTGFIVGTLGYMAPEQIQGRDVDGRTDLYALGILLYEMVSGRLPFEANSEWDLMQQQVSHPPPPLVEPADVPPRVLDAIMRALQKVPDARFQTAAEFFEELTGRAIHRDDSAADLVVPHTGTAAPDFYSGAGASPTRLADGAGPTGTDVGERPVAAIAAAGALPETRLAGALVPAPSLLPSTRLADGAAGAHAGQGVLQPTRLAPRSKEPQPPPVAASPMLSGRQAAALVSAAVVVAAVAFGAFRWWQTPRPAPAVSASATAVATTPVSEPTGGGSAPIVTENPAPNDLQPQLPPGALARPGSVRPPAAPRSATPSEPGGPSPAESEARSETSAVSVTHDDARTLAFEKVKLVHQEGGKTKESNVVLELRSDRVALLDPDSRAPMKSMRYEAIRAVTYSRSKHPRWKEGIGAAVAVGVLAAPVFFMKGTKHWLTLQATGDYLMLHLDKNNYKSIVAALEARSRLRVATEAGDQ